MISRERDFGWISRILRIGRSIVTGLLIGGVVASPAAGQCLEASGVGSLSPSDHPLQGRYGKCVAIDGNTAAVGSGKSGVYIYTRPAPGGSWTEQALLSAGGFFGASVALSGDTLAVGAPSTSVSGLLSAGAVHVFVRSGTIWTLQQMVVAADPKSGAQFGSSVAISGGVVIAGAPFDSPGGLTSAGSAYIFYRTGSTWSQFIKMLASDRTSNDLFGNSVALTNVNVFPPQQAAIIGAVAGDRPGVTGSGAAYVFLREPIIDGETWTQRAKLTASDGQTGDNFGSSIAASGATVVLGAPRAATPLLQAGAAYVFTSSGTGLTWTQRAKLLPSSPQANARFGASVGISGGTIVAGAPKEDIPSFTDLGAAYAFTGSGSSWALIDRLQSSGGTSGDFTSHGTGVAVNGTTILMGGPGDTGSPTEFSGRVALFEVRRLDITHQPSAVSVCLTGPATFTVAATGTSTVAFQWRKGGAPIAGATGATFSIPSVSMADAGSYDCVMTDNCGSLTSAAATLTVNGADPDCSGAVTTADVAAFVNLWFGSLGGTGGAGDFDANGRVEAADVAVFVSTWFANL